ncbi:MAG: hypothetical protein NWE92_04495 [Candidatus Bathyarchaeota archaeon]|nr:hypothetical protein [Candidatus Bathyarchaeota archaeon]
MDFALAKMCLRSLQREFACYYDTIFSRKAASPICIVLCSTIIVTYVLSQIGI